MNIQQAKEMDMVDYLSVLGHMPAKISGIHYWYLSPLREERTPSFKVNRRLNTWYDFAEGRGGNLIDFGMIYHCCDVRELLQKLEGKLVPAPRLVKKETVENKDRKVVIQSLRDITSLPLLHYLKTRHIPMEIATRYLKEAHYGIGDKNYYALAFQNDLGGHELRNEYFKGSSSPKGITFIDNKARELAVFEGVFDFLSYKVLFLKQEELLRNFLVLNSTSFFVQQMPLMQQHGHVHLFLDNDHTGDRYTQLAMSADRQTFTDERRLYRKHNDLNDWLKNFGTTTQQHKFHL